MSKTGNNLVRTHHLPSVGGLNDKSANESYELTNLPPIKSLGSQTQKPFDYLKQSRVDRANMRKERKLNVQLEKMNEQIKQMT